MLLEDGRIGALIWRMPVDCARWFHGTFATAPQCRIPVLALDVVSPDPWLGRRGSLLVSVEAGRGKLERVDPRDQHLGWRLGFVCAPAQAHILCARSSVGPRRHVAASRPRPRSRLFFVRKRPGTRTRRQSDGREQRVETLLSLPGADLLGGQQLAYGAARFARRRAASRHARSPR